MVEQLFVILIAVMFIVILVATCISILNSNKEDVRLDGEILKVEKEIEILERQLATMWYIIFKSLDDKKE